MADFCSGDFAVWEASASLKRCIEVILRIELKQSYCEILESVPAILAKISWNVHPSLSGCSALAGIRQYITVCLYITEIWPVLMACSWKNRVRLAAFWDNLAKYRDFSGPNEALVIRVEIFPSTSWFLLGWFPARRSRFRVSRRATYCARQSLTLYRPVVHTYSHFGARVRRRDMPRGTARAPPQVLNILTAREPMGPSSRRRLILLASHRMAPSRERKNPSRIARLGNRDFFDFRLVGPLWLPTLVPKHNSRFWVFRRTICWLLWSIKRQKKLLF